MSTHETAEMADGEAGPSTAECPYCRKVLDDCDNFHACTIARLRAKLAAAEAERDTKHAVLEDARRLAREMGWHGKLTPGGFLRFIQDHLSDAEARIAELEESERLAVQRMNEAEEVLGRDSNRIAELEKATRYQVGDSPGDCAMRLTLGISPTAAVLPAVVQCCADRDAAILMVQDLIGAAREAETLLTNYLANGHFPPGSDCEEVRDILRDVLSEALAGKGESDG